MKDGLYEQIIQELNAHQEIRSSDIVMFSEPLRSALKFAAQAKRFSLTELSEKLEFTREQSGEIARLLVEQHLLRLAPAPDDPEPYYEIHFPDVTP